jgi:hypothetical protein
VQNIPLVTMKVEDFIGPVTVSMQSHFLTAIATAKIMITQGSGVIYPSQLRRVALDIPIQVVLHRPVAPSKAFPEILHPNWAYMASVL